MKSYPWCIGNIIFSSTVCTIECPYRNKCFLETFYRSTPELKIVKVYPKSLENFWIKRIYK